MGTRISVISAISGSGPYPDHSPNLHSTVAPSGNHSQWTGSSPRSGLLSFTHMFACSVQERTGGLYRHTGSVRQEGLRPIVGLRRRTDPDRAGGRPARMRPPAAISIAGVDVRHLRKHVGKRQIWLEQVFVIHNARVVDSVDPVGQPCLQFASEGTLDEGVEQRNLGDLHRVECVDDSTCVFDE